LWLYAENVVAVLGGGGWCFVAAYNGYPVSWHQTPQTRDTPGSCFLDTGLEMWGEYGEVKWVNIGLQRRDDRGQGGGKLFLGVSRY